jgi:hypothetical protein
MTKKYNSSSFWIKGNFFFSVGRYVHEIAFDAIKPGKFLFFR